MEDIKRLVTKDKESTSSPPGDTRLVFRSGMALPHGITLLCPLQHVTCRISDVHHPCPQEGQERMKECEMGGCIGLVCKWRYYTHSYPRASQLQGSLENVIS